MERLLMTISVEVAPATLDTSWDNFNMTASPSLICGVISSLTPTS